MMISFINWAAIKLHGNNLELFLKSMTENSIPCETHQGQETDWGCDNDLVEKHT